MGCEVNVNFVTEEPDISVPCDVKTLMLVFTLGPLEATFLQAMLSTKGWVGKDEIPEARASIRQMIYKLRTKIEPRKVWVLNDGRGRYSIDPSSKRVAKALIEAALPHSGE